MGINNPSVSLDFAQFNETQAAGVSAGAFNNGAWRTRVLNTAVANNIVGASLAANQITLPKGKYLIQAVAPAYTVRGNQLRLQDVTNNVTLLAGRSVYSGNTGSVTSCATLSGTITLNADTLIELQHQCETTVAANGLGVGNTFNSNIFASIDITKIG